MKLRTRYSLAILSLILCLVVFFTGIVLLKSRSTIKTLASDSSKAMEEGMLGELGEKERLSVKVLATALTNAVYQYDMQRIYEFINAMREQPDVLYVYVYDKTGHIVHDGTKELLLYDKVLDDELSKRALADKQAVSQTERDTLNIAAPIMLHDELLGGVKVAFSLKGIKTDITKLKDDLRAQYQESETSDWFAIIFTALGFSILGVFVALFLARSWSQPISILSTLTSRVGRSEYDLDIPINRSDEIGELATSFRYMVENLKEIREKEKRQAAELREAYLQVKKTNEDILAANKAKDEFLSVMSHELRTPLNVVMGYSGMIRDKMLGEINPEQERALDKVMTRSGDLLTMITEILQATSLETRAVKMEEQEVSLSSFLDDLKSNYEVPVKKELSFGWDYPSELPTVRTDGEKLKHILQNLINNAVKFTERGQVTISARYNPKAKAVEFKVADTGIGIQKEMLPTIFEMFRQGDSSETRSHGGIGIGLYIVRKFTDLLGGTIDAVSEPGKGSIFTVTIPC